MTQEQARPAVLYAAKSTEDTHGSIPTQLADARNMAEREGWEVVGEYQDEGFSAYSGNRGRGLGEAKRRATEVAAERGVTVMLCAQHSDRLARGAGDAPGAADSLVEIWHAMRRQRVHLRSVQNDSELSDPVLVAVAAKRDHEDSRRKSEAVTAGLTRRKERGSPVGPVPLGYKVKESISEDKVITNRVIDPAAASTVERIFELVESGATFGDVARTLNTDGIRTRPRKDHPDGHTWVSRTVRGIVHNRAYVGEKGYPTIIEPGRFDAIHASLDRLDQVQVTKRRGGRKPRDESFFLRGIGNCLSCGGTLYTRRYAAGRVYVCRHGRDGSGLCSAAPIPADLIESHVVRHMNSFVGSVEEWIAGRVEERDDERQVREAALERQRQQLRDLDRRAERFRAEWRRLVDEGKTTASIALDEVERVEREQAEQVRMIEEAEAIVSEWAGPPDVDAALDFYNRLVDQVQGRIQKAEGATELNMALRQVVAGLWTEVGDERLLVEFELVGHDWDKDTLPGGIPIRPEFRQRPQLPPRLLDDGMEPEPLELIRQNQADESGTQTFV
ncbi:MAG: recombinase family protein [Solirubrobacterales bacterium]